MVHKMKGLDIFSQNVIMIQNVEITNYKMAKEL